MGVYVIVIARSPGIYGSKPSELVRGRSPRARLVYVAINLGAVLEVSRCFRRPKVLRSLRASKSCRNRPKQCLTNLDHSNAIKNCDPIGLDAMIKLTSVN